MMPHFKQHKEYESLLHMKRVEYGLTVKKLSQLSMVAVYDIVSLANGTMAPVRNDGHICVSAAMLLDFFGLKLEELFPRYACAQKICLPEYEPYETYSEKISENSCSQYENREILAKIIEKSHISKKEMTLLCRFVVENESLIDIGEHLVTRQAINSRVNNVLKKLRKAYQRLQLAK